jgi:hypothetical protein
MIDSSDFPTKRIPLNHGMITQEEQIREALNKDSLSEPVGSAKRVTPH